MKTIFSILFLILVLGLVRSDDFACSTFPNDTGKGPSTVTVALTTNNCTTANDCQKYENTFEINRAEPYFVANTSSLTNETGTYYDAAFFYDGEQVCIYLNFTNQASVMNVCGTSVKCEVSNCLTLDKANTDQVEDGYTLYNTCDGAQYVQYVFAISTEDDPQPPKTACGAPDAPSNSTGPNTVEISIIEYATKDNSTVNSPAFNTTLTKGEPFFFGNVSESNVSDNAVFYDGEKVCVYAVVYTSDCVNDNSTNCTNSCLYISNLAQRNVTLLTHNITNCDTSSVTQNGFSLSFTIAGENNGSSSDSHHPHPGTSSNDSESESDGSNASKLYGITFASIIVLILSTFI